MDEKDQESKKRSIDTFATVLYWHIRAAKETAQERAFNALAPGSSTDDERVAAFHVGMLRGLEKAERLLHQFVPEANAVTEEVRK